MYRNPLLYFIIFLATICCACTKENSANADRRPVLAVSIEPQRKLLQSLAGNEFKVVCVLPRGANPETFDPTMAQRIDAAKADVYFAIGFLPFEKAITAEIEKTGRVVNSTQGITPVYGTHSHGNHTHAEADPHLWASLRNGKTIAANMARTLAEMDPERSSLYRSRLDSVCAALDSLDSGVASSLAPGTAFALWHPSLSYFARDYGLRQIAVGQESKESSLSSLSKAIEQAKADSVKVFFFQKEFDSRQAENICKEIGADMVRIDPLAFDWDTQITDIANAIRQRSKTSD